MKHILFFKSCCEYRQEMLFWMISLVRMWRQTGTQSLHCALLQNTMPLARPWMQHSVSFLYGWSSSVAFCTISHFSVFFFSNLISHISIFRAKVAPPWSFLCREPPVPPHQSFGTRCAQRLGLQWGHPCSVNGFIHKIWELWGSRSGTQQTSWDI